jgi:ubiquitin-conjugating enzyme E2 J2
VNDRICLSISDYHPESWNPVWPVRSIIIGLISFFVTNDSTVGAIERSHTERKIIAKLSREKILKNKYF